MWKVIFLQNRAFCWFTLAIGMSREFELRVNCQARLYFLSCSTLVVMTLQLLACFTRVALWQLASCESVARSNRETYLECTQLEFLHIPSHTTLTLFAPKYRVSNCWNYKQIWYGIKPTHGWINLTLHHVLERLGFCLEKQENHCLEWWWDERWP